MTETGLTVLNSIISAGIGAISALAVVLIEGRREKKKEKQNEYDTYKKYSKPIMFAAETLAWRINEILTFNAAFLLPDAPENGFFKYKFDSTVYRLCALIGWIRAAQKEHSYLEGFGNTKNAKVRESIISLQKVLADGSQVEVSIIEELSKLYNIPIKELSDKVRSEIGVECERIVFKYIPDQVKKNVALLKDKEQLKLVNEVIDLICEKTQSTKLEKKEIKKKLDIAIDEIAREFCWIYRDWQNAIGDEMLIKLNDSYRYYDVIGFSAFMDKNAENVWLQKVNNLFANLDISIDNRFDSRVGQIKDIYIALINLIQELNNSIEDEQAISSNSLDKLSQYSAELKKQRGKVL
ncbi:conserved hypothetical protein [Tenacibaculum sediminilitoris]|uniref:hypothetical protein n=1 Tax=Tenacibaculum sediminilitoris TaxID=1820334 RepID=UPI0038935BEE